MHIHFLGVGLAVLSMLFFSVTYASYKVCSSYLPNTHAIFFQSLMSWVIILPFALKNGVKSLISPVLGKIFARTAFGILSLYCITRALKTAGLAEVITLSNTSPLFVPLILWFLHKVKISLRLFIGLFIGFIGVWIIFEPGFKEIHVELALAFLSGVFSAFLVVLTPLIAHEPFRRIMFYYFLFFWLALLPFVFLEWTPFSSIAWLYITLAAITMIVGQVSFTMAARYATAKEIAPTLYTSVIFSAIIDWLIWNKTPSLVSTVGMIVVCIGGLVTMNFTKKRVR